MQDEEKTPLKPRGIFLVIAAVFLFGAVAAYAYQDDIIWFGGSENQMAFVTLLIFLIVTSMFFVFCYRSPALGERIFFGRADIVEKDEGSYHYSAGFKTETGMAEKRINTQRKSRRAMRKRYAEETRKLQEKTED